MKLVIFGSRDLPDFDSRRLFSDLDAYIATWWPDETVEAIISGTARGADRVGEAYGICRDLPIERFPAKWDVHGRKAGFIRNGVMAQVADGGIALWNGHSRGTAHMLEQMKDLRKPVLVIRFLEDGLVASMS